MMPHNLVRARRADKRAKIAEPRFPPAVPSTLSN